MLTNKELGRFLEEIRKQRKLTLRQVDYKSDVSYSHLSMIEKGTRKALPLTLKELARVYDISYIDLLEKAGYIDLAEKERIETKTDLLGNPVITIPILGTVKAGYDYLAQENWIGTYDLEKKLADTGDFFALRVKGNSMSPNLLENDIVIIKKQDDFIDGNIVVALINGDEATIKVAKRVKNGIKLIPINLAEYEPLFFTEDEIKNKPVRIIGIVKKLDREF